ncbi:MAG: hypothetical protein Q7K34_01885 [archaeon]|nr:hypothetical protein [archaeon]
MVSFTSFSLGQAYKRVEGLGDRLIQVEKLVNWAKFQSIISKLYSDDKVILLEADCVSTTQKAFLEVLNLLFFYG